LSSTATASSTMRDVLRTTGEKESFLVML
jgi:hypothetical protein